MYYRQRKRDDLKDYVPVMHYRHPAGDASNGNDTDYPADPRAAGSFQQTVTDVVGAFDSFNPVDSTVHIHPGNNSPFGPISHPNGATITPVDIRVSWPSRPWGEYIPVVPAGLVAAAVDRAFVKLSQQVPTEISLPNFLYELREVKDLIPSLDSNAASLVPDQYLNYQFGWKPFLGDLGTLRSIVDSTRARLQYLRDTWGRQVRVTHVETLPVSLPTLSIQYGVHVDYVVDLVPTSWTAEFRAGGYLYHQLQRLDGFEGELRAFSSALGFLNPSLALWNAVPYSFVLGWFTRVEGLFERLAAQPFPGTWQLSKVGYSVKSTYTYDVRVGDRFHTARAAGGVGRHVNYSRVSGLPVSAAIIGNGNTLTPTQQMLAAALLYGRRHG